jgi:hypothetical protein
LAWDPDSLLAGHVWSLFAKFVLVHFGSTPRGSGHPGDRYRSRSDCKQRTAALMAAAVASIPSEPPGVHAHADAELHLPGQQVHRRHPKTQQTGWIDSPSDTPRSSSSSNNDFDALTADQVQCQQQVPRQTVQAH